ncbi:MAG: hypothetical protein ACO3AW_07770 [Chitinophagaceae bacterium]
MRVRKKMRFLLLMPIAIILWLLVDQFLLCPTIDFPQSSQFTGTNIYNPYAGLDTNDIAVANFHAHSKAWSGLTNGKGSAMDIWRRYDSMGYSFNGVSQYFTIDTFNQAADNYVPVYEHGMNVKKTHQLVIGAQSVVWKDYIFPQTINNKQFIINKIAEDPNAMIVLNHPGMLSGYTKEDLQKLYNYDFVEILNPQAQSLAHWDAALSSGHAVFGLADDDVHNVFKNSLISRFYNIVYNTGKKTSGLYQSLKQGKHIAVWAPKVDSDNLSNKREKIDTYKILMQYAEITHDTIHVKFSQAIDTVKIIGQNGTIISQMTQKSEVFYHIKPTDSYIRVEYIIKDGTRFYMNPFFRY